MAYKRNYRKEYDNYQGKPTQIKKGLVTKGDGKDVHHSTGNPMNNSRLAVKSKSKNRSFARNKNAGKKVRNA